MRVINILNILFSNSLILFGVFFLNWNIFTTLAFIFIDFFIYILQSYLNLKNSKQTNKPLKLFGISSTQKQKTIDATFAFGFGIWLLCAIVIFGSNLSNNNLTSLYTIENLITFVTYISIKFILIFLSKSKIQNIQENIDRIVYRALVFLIAIIYSLVVTMYTKIENIYAVIIIYVLVNAIFEYNPKLINKLFLVNSYK